MRLQSQLCILDNEKKAPISGSISKKILLRWVNFLLNSGAHTIQAMYEYSSVEFGVRSMYALSMRLSMHFLIMVMEGANLALD